MALEQKSDELKQSIKLEKVLISKRILIEKKGIMYDKCGLSKTCIIILISTFP